MVTLEGTREALVQSNGQGAGVAGLSIVSKWEVAGGEVGGKGRRRSGPPGTQWRLPDVTLSVAGQLSLLSNQTGIGLIREMGEILLSFCG